MFVIFYSKNRPSIANCSHFPSFRSPIKILIFIFIHRGREEFISSWNLLYVLRERINFSRISSSSFFRKVTVVLDFPASSKGERLVSRKEEKRNIYVYIECLKAEGREEWKSVLWDVLTRNRYLLRHFYQPSAINYLSFSETRFLP